MTLMPALRRFYEIAPEYVAGSHAEGDSGDDPRCATNEGNVPGFGEARAVAFRANRCPEGDDERDCESGAKADQRGESDPEAVHKLSIGYRLLLLSETRAVRPFKGL